MNLDTSKFAHQVVTNHFNVCGEHYDVEYNQYSYQFMSDRYEIEIPFHSDTVYFSKNGLGWIDDRTAIHDEIIKHFALGVGV